MLRVLARRARWVCAFVALLAHPALAADGEALVAHEDAYVTRDQAANTWSIGNAGVEFVVGVNGSQRLTAERLWNPQTGEEWTIAPDPDTTITVGGRRLHLETSADVSFSGATAAEIDGGVQLTFTFQDRQTRVFLQHVYLAYAGAPTIETWTRVENGRATPVAISDMVGWQMTMTTGGLRWVNGLRGDSASEWNADSFTICGGPLEDGQNVTIGSDRRSSESYLPFVFVDGETQTFYGGIIWSGSWQIAATEAGDQLTLAATIPGVSRTVMAGRPLELPHAFFGLSARASSAQASALRRFVVRGIRKSRGFRPLVTYNTWFSYGADVTETDVDDEMHRVADLGAELFVLDAGWLEGAGSNGRNDFTSGLGTWRVDPDKFPAQLEGLADQAHDLGMLFGLWVEPERVARAAIGQPGLAKEAWLAKANGSYESDDSAQVCLAAPAARAWVFDQLTALIDRVHPDYIKWDNNAWVNCNRTGHDHGSSDGNFAHVQALYGLLADIRTRYPDLIIENVSGGGNRLDFGMLAYSDTAWMDDRTAPSSLVRHNIEGLSTAFPPGYLLSFVIDNETDILGGPDMPSIVRSRMLGILGLTIKSADYDDDTRARLAAAIAEYKSLRDTIGESAAGLLGPQAPIDDGWEVVQEVSDDQQRGVVFVFKATEDAGGTIVRLEHLVPETVYAVRSLDRGDLGTATGADLMRTGIEIDHRDGPRAHVLVLAAQ